MIDEVHGLNAHMMISIWSSFGPKTKPFKELEKEGLLMDMATWPNRVWKDGRLTLIILLA